MPYSYNLLKRLEVGEVVQKRDFHRFWWLKRNLDEKDEFLGIEEPNVVTRSKGGREGASPSLIRLIQQPLGTNGTGQRSITLRDNRQPLSWKI
jgi:hypothetical protein